MEKGWKTVNLFPIILECITHVQKYKNLSAQHVEMYIRGKVHFLFRLTNKDILMLINGMATDSFR